MRLCWPAARQRGGSWCLRTSCTHLRSKQQPSQAGSSARVWSAGERTRRPGGLAQARARGRQSRPPAGLHRSRRPRRRAPLRSLRRPPPLTARARRPTSPARPRTCSRPRCSPPSPHRMTPGETQQLLVRAAPGAAHRPAPPGPAKRTAAEPARGGACYAAGLQPRMAAPALRSSELTVWLASQLACACHSTARKPRCAQPSIAATGCAGSGQGRAANTHRLQAEAPAGRSGARIGAPGRQHLGGRAALDQAQRDLAVNLLQLLLQTTLTRTLTLGGTLADAPRLTRRSATLR